MGGRLIEADELIELIDDDIASIDPDCESVARCTLKMVKLYIKALPTVENVPLEDYRSMEQTVYKLTQSLAEAEPRKHGRWIKSKKSDFAWECSNCGYGLSDYRTTYCYDCGARMDEDCRECALWERCPCGKAGHENGTSVGYSIGECKMYDPIEIAKQYAPKFDKPVVDMMEKSIAEPYIEFCEWVADTVLYEDFEDKWTLGAFAEVACRKLHKLGFIRKDGEYWTRGDTPTEKVDTPTENTNRPTDEEDPSHPFAESVMMGERKDEVEE